MSILDIAQQVKDTPDNAGVKRDFSPPREGVALMRMTSVIEMGEVMSEWKGVEKKNRKVIVEFELLHPDHAIKNSEGELVRYHTLLVYLNKSGFDKSKYMKLFNKLNYDGSVHVEKGSIPPMSRFLGKPFLGHIHHNPSKDGKKVYVNLNKGDDYTIGAPRVPVQDEMGVPTGEFKDVPVPAMHMDPRLFLWEPLGITDEQYAEMWASIHVDGRNWFQEQIMGPDNVAWEGSRAQALFGQGFQVPVTAHEETVDDIPWSTTDEKKAARVEAPAATQEVDVDDIDVVETPQVTEPPRKRRKRRTKAEMEEFRKEQARIKAEKAAKKNGAAPKDDYVDPLEALGL